MPGVARIGDIAVGVCPCHPTPVGFVGVIASGSIDVITNGSGTARIGDIAVCSCGHATVVVSGSGSVKTNAIGTARIGDVVAACPIGVIASGSTDTLAGG